MSRRHWKLSRSWLLWFGKSVEEVLAVTRDRVLRLVPELRELIAVTPPQPMPFRVCLAEPMPCRPGRFSLRDAPRVPLRDKIAADGFHLPSDQVCGDSPYSHLYLASWHMYFITAWANNVLYGPGWAAVLDPQDMPTINSLNAAHRELRGKRLGGHS